jgi:hypothetical protein
MAKPSTEGGGFGIVLAALGLGTGLEECPAWDLPKAWRNAVIGPFGGKTGDGTGRLEFNEMKRGWPMGEKVNRRRLRVGSLWEDGRFFFGPGGIVSIVK